jgi:hypothetical protein
MSTAADRKKAREVYLATLNQQRDEATATTKPAPGPPSAPVAYSSREQKMNAREKMLEEKRLKFLQKSGKVPDPASAAASGDNSNSKSSSDPVNGAPTASALPPRFAQQQQQQPSLQQPPQQQPPQQQQPPVEITAPPTSLQAGKHGDDGMNVLANRYGKRDDPIYRPKPKQKVEVAASSPASSDPFATGDLNLSRDQTLANADSTSVQKDPFAHTIRPQQMNAVNVAGGGGGMGNIGECCH